ncbi:hypothetical protein [Marinicella meishanensis]|uniref:hypothetical protein n=1 Tax=Marinicella meishanensis TaxID=2873263 RepID=UPI001CC1A1E9|nr:hypothetical protein [Marinicella sp. NBU2979]
MKQILKNASMLLLLITLTTAEAKLSLEQADDSNDKDYQALIIGRWVEDKDQQQRYEMPVYIEYFADGRAVAKIFDEETCVELMVSNSYWKILNGNLYYKFDFETDWSMDRIIKMAESHYVLRSKDQMLYRKKGSFCDD